MNASSAVNLTSLAFNKLTHLSYRSGELEPYLENICSSIIDILGEGVAAVTLLKDNKKHVLAVVPKARQPESAVDAHGYLSTYVVTQKKTLNVEDATQTSEYGTPPEGYCSYLGVPLRLPNGKVVGTLCYFNKHKRLYSTEEQQVSELFAERAAIALDNFEQYQQLKQYSDTLESQVEKRSAELSLVQAQLVHKEKLAVIGEFASHLTHEIRNPLATIGLALDYLKKSGDDKATKRAKLAANEVTRLEKLLNEVLLYAKPVHLSIKPLLLNQWLDDFLMTHGSLAEQKNLIFKHQGTLNLKVYADADKLTQICLNLLRNASDASPNKGRILWHSGVLGGMGFISVHNSGDSIPVEKLSQITEPFVSMKAGGSGFGLAIVKSLIAAHHGELEIKSEALSGTIITFTLPLVKS